MLAVTAQGNSIAHARKIAYKAVEAIGWKEGFLEMISVKKCMIIFFSLKH